MTVYENTPLVKEAAKRLHASASCSSLYSDKEYETQLLVDNAIFSVDRATLFLQGAYLLRRVTARLAVLSVFGEHKQHLVAVAKADMLSCEDVDSFLAILSHVIEEANIDYVGRRMSASGLAVPPPKHLFENIETVAKALKKGLKRNDLPASHWKGIGKHMSELLLVLCSMDESIELIKNATYITKDNADVQPSC